MQRLAYSLVSLVAAAAAHGQQAPSRPFASPDAMAASPPSDTGSLAQVTLALAFTLALIFGAAWLLRRVRTFGKPSGAALEILADLPVGPKERAVLIRVGTTQMLIGVAPGHLSTLHVLSEPVQPVSPASISDPAAPARPSFRDLLMKSLGK